MRESHRQSQSLRRLTTNRGLRAKLRLNPNPPTKSPGHERRPNPRLKLRVEIGHPPPLSEVALGAGEGAAAGRAEAGNRLSLKLSPRLE